MNADAAQRYASRATALREVGLDGCRRSALASLRARTVVKESHATPVTAMVFNTVEPTVSNLFASVGGDQATIYDDCHFGDFVGIVAQYTHTPAPGQPASTEADPALTAVGWVSAPPAPGPHPHGDAWLAVGGADGALSVISVSEARVSFRMEGRAGGEGGGRVISVAGTPRARPGLAAGLQAGGALTLWCVAAEAALAAWSAPGATCVVADPTGAHLALGDDGGRVRLVPLPAASAVEGEGVHATASPPSPPPLPPPSPLPPAATTLAHPGTASPVECLAFLGPDGRRLVARHADGRLAVWGGVGGGDAPALLASWRVPGAAAGPHSSVPGPSAAALSATADGALLAVGSPDGEALVFDLSATLGGGSGGGGPPTTTPPPILARVKPPRVGGPVRAVALSDDGRHLSVAVGGGFVFRFEASVFGAAAVAVAPVGKEEAE